ncbi:hypothetical protein CEXT_436901 [Caerostris extrusa]|uniref:Uncharacterized protein n=1 Tax=Caerostris extrusa TaxID=172846 RepID=A0AAV4XH96_CAEEX|nr:hypothetical protein CEXT_436901 [Caerostris extrusa]
MHQAGYHDFSITLNVIPGLGSVLKCDNGSIELLHPAIMDMARWIFMSLISVEVTPYVRRMCSTTWCVRRRDLSRQFLISCSGRTDEEGISLPVPQFLGGRERG